MSDVKPLYKHSYPYGCEFLGSFEKYDLYHTIVREKPMLITRYGDETFQFYGEESSIGLKNVDDMGCHMGEAYRRAKILKLTL